MSDLVRIKGDIQLSSNFEVKKKGALDARTIVPSFAELCKLNKGNYIPDGLPVSVTGTDLSKRGLYLCIDDNLSDTPADNVGKWQKLGSIKIAVLYSAASGSGFSYADTVLTFTLTSDIKALFPYITNTGVLNAVLRQQIASGKFKELKSFDPIINDDGSNFTSVQFEGVTDPNNLQIVLS